MTTYAVDFESHYSDTCSIGLSGTWNYLRHPDCDIYMVAIVGDDGTEWVGRPEEFDWSSIARPDTTWVAHNYSFDAAVYTRLIELGKVPDVWPGHWFCSADAAAYHGLPRNLKGAIEAKFKGILEVSKDTRNAMKGQHWDSMTPEFQKEVSEYALHDSRCCLALWKALEATFPWHERMISQHTAWMGWEGLPVNRDKIEEGIQTLKDQMWEAEQNIPWAGTEKLLSPKALADECRKVGIDPPRSLAQDSEECEAWLDKYGSTYPWIGAMRTWRRCNALLKKLEAMLSRVRPDGVMGFGMKFFGAHTGRDSGDAGFNVQNMPRGEMFGVNLREMIEAPAGKTFVIVDLAQIEPRCLFSLAGDTRMLDAVRAGYGIYEAFAVGANMWNGPVGTLKKTDPILYQTAKAACLGCGFGMSGNKFHVTAPALTGGAYAPTLAEAEAVVQRYRQSYKSVTGLWDMLDKAMRRHVGKDFEIELPSGRILRYGAVQNYGGLSAVIMRMGKLTRCKFWHGTLTENLVQATARDVFMDCTLRTLRAGYDVCLRVHDECVALVDEDQAEAALDDIIKIFSTPPVWMPNLPIACEGTLSKVYTK